MNIKQNNKKTPEKLDPNKKENETINQPEGDKSNSGILGAFLGGFFSNKENKSNKTKEEVKVNKEEKITPSQQTIVWDEKLKRYLINGEVPKEEHLVPPVVKDEKKTVLPPPVKINNFNPELIKKDNNKIEPKKEVEKKEEKELISIPEKKAEVKESTNKVIDNPFMTDPFKHVKQPENKSKVTVKKPGIPNIQSRYTSLLDNNK